jgi:ATP-dependent Lhr-like helicase
MAGRIVAGMLERGLLWDEAGVLWLGREGQDTYGRRHFLELVSVFTTPPLFAVLHGRHELGSVDESTFLARRDAGSPVLLLAGRAWRVNHLDWKRRRAYVEPAEDAGRSRWRGGGQFLGYQLCRAIRHVLAADDISPHWSRRAATRIASARAEYLWLAGGEDNVLASSGGEVAWWTFAGGRANAALAHGLAQETGLRVVGDNFAVRFPPHIATVAAGAALRGLLDTDPGGIVPALDDKAIDGLKFSECLPPDVATRVARARVSDPQAVAGVLGRPTRTVIGT